MPNLHSALMALALLALPSPALADETTASGKNAPANSLRARFGRALGRFEGPRDMNLFQLEPSILNERYYTSGESEHHQFVGNVLPAGAPIPDNEAAGNTTTGAKKQPAPLDDKTKPAPVLNRSTNTTQPALSQPATASTQEQKQSGNKQ
ncbi:MAG: hypothetical protein SFV17_10685 [Candidatus Obscuribacter sp.]|nr:hypothetical protein [Candidatus Obscuribacter sp.]